jgi:hypothetical protein
MIFKIPNHNNLYGTIFNIASKKALADMFGARVGSFGNQHGRILRQGQIGVK